MRKSLLLLGITVALSQPVFAQQQSPVMCPSTTPKTGVSPASPHMMPTYPMMQTPAGQPAGGAAEITSTAQAPFYPSAPGVPMNPMLVQPCPVIQQAPQIQTGGAACIPCIPCPCPTGGASPVTPQPAITPQSDTTDIPRSRVRGLW